MGRRCSALLQALVWALAPALALARLNETAAECEKRYGNPSQEILAEAPALTVRVYTNGHNTITCVFIPDPGHKPKVGCIYYTKYEGGWGSWLWQRRFTDDERAGLLATVPGKWQDYAHPQQSDGKIMTGMAPPGAITIQRYERGQAIIAAMAPRLVPLRPSMRLDVKPVANNRSQTFAYRYYYNLFLISYEGIEALETWQRKAADVRIPQTNAPPQPPPGY
jgi:hypothetical protein